MNIQVKLRRVCLPVFISAACGLAAFLQVSHADTVAPAAPVNLAIASGATPTPQPGALQISGVSGVVRNGSTITVSGSGFGARNATDSDVFDDFEDGFGPHWYLGTDDYTLGLSVSAKVRGAGAQAIYGNIPDGGDKHYALRKRASAGAPTSHRWYVSVNLFFDPNFTWGQTTSSWRSNMKMMRMWREGSNGCGQRENWGVIYHGWTGSGGLVLANEYVVPQTVDYVVGNFRSLMTPGSWHQVEYVFDEAAGVNADGVVGALSIYVDGILRASEELETYEDCANVAPSLWNLGFDETSNASGGSDMTNEFWMDNVVAASSWARLILCDAGTFSACTVREFQPPSAWSNNSITAAVNTGLIPNGGAYLYVVDAAGSVSPAYAVTVANP